MRPGLASLVAFTSMVWLACSSPAPATLEFVDQNPPRPRLGEITTLRFRAVDTRGSPQAGTRVTFALQSPVPGVELSPTEGTTNPGDGMVSVQIVARGGRVASAVVVASAGEGAEVKTVISPVIAFAGTSSSSRQLTFQCGSFSGDGSGLHHAIGAWDETRNLIAGVKLNCVAHVGDRNGDGIEGAQVSFLTEAGTIGPSATSVTDVVGNAKVLYKSSLPLPQDVPPGEFTWNPTNDSTHTGEYLAPLWMHPFLWEENPVAAYGGAAADPFVPRPEPRRADPIRPGITLNPRDNLVSIIAVTAGEEAFDDNNNNGQWDQGEPFVDLTEPFVDNNDNGTWDPNERFVDTNGDGKWNGKNGTFDASTLIWVQERILWTGWPHALDRRDTVRQISPAPGTAIHIAHFSSARSTFLVADPWYNRIAQNSDGDGCKGGAEGPVEIEPFVTGAIAFTYPSFNVEQYVVSDRHDETQEPQPPPYSTAVNWKADATCTYTAAQLEGHKAFVAAPPLAGDVL